MNTASHDLKQTIKNIKVMADEISMKESKISLKEYKDSLKRLFEFVNVANYRTFNKVSFRVANIVILQERIDIRKSKTKKCRDSECIKLMCKDKRCGVINQRENYDFSENRKLAKQRFSLITDYKSRDYEDLDKVHPQYPRIKFENSKRSLNKYKEDLIYVYLEKSWLFDYEKSYLSISAILKHLES